MGFTINTKWLVAAISVNAVAGQLLLKYALGVLGGRTALATIPKFLLHAAVSPWIYASIAVQGFGYFLWMLLISRERLGVATASVGAGFYILMPLCAYAVYGETLNYLQWFGIGLITAGVICVSANGLG